LSLFLVPTIFMLLARREVVRDEAPVPETA